MLTGIFFPTLTRLQQKNAPPSSYQHLIIHYHDRGHLQPCMDMCGLGVHVRGIASNNA